MPNSTILLQCCSCIGLVVVVPATSSADSWGRPMQHEYWSKHRTAVLKLTPDKHPDERPGHCLAELFRCKDGNRALAWSRTLINNAAPVGAMVADSGDYAVTFDEWEFLGKLPIVIYGPKGELIAAHSFETLGNIFEGAALTGATSGPLWREHSLTFFGPNEQTLFLRLGWGKVVTLQLDNGGVINDDWPSQRSWRYTKDQLKSLLAFGDTQIREMALAHLHSRASEDRETGALVAQQLKLREAIPRLRELLSDPAFFTRSQGDAPGRKIYHIRKAAKEALEAMGEKVGGVELEMPLK